MKKQMFNPVSRWLQLALWKKILLALLAGMATGLILGPRAEHLQFIGIIFIHAIQLLVVPVVFTAIVCAVISVDSETKMRRVVIKAFVVYALSMAAAAVLGIGVALLINPGLNFHISLAHSSANAVVGAPTLQDVLVSFIPSNALVAFSKNNVMQILVFAVLMGVAIRAAGKTAEPVAHIFKAFSSVVFKFAEIIVGFAPYGIFALIAYVFGRYGLAALLPLFKFVLTVYLADVAQCILVYGVVLVLCGINPLAFLRNIMQAVLLAYTTSSSAATLPVTMRCAEEGLGLDRTLSRFLLPLGTTFNLNGLSIYLSVAVIFAANIFGISLHLSQLLTVVVTILFTAAGAAAVPGSGLIMMTAVMNAAGIPLGALPLIAGVDRFNDMAQTATNVIGDLFAASVVAKSEGKMYGDIPPVGIDHETTRS